MYQIRTTITGSGKTAVQVVEYRDGQTHIIKHFGSAATPLALTHLSQTAREWIDTQTNQLVLLPTPIVSGSTWVEKDKLTHLRSQPMLLYHTLTHYISLLGFSGLIDDICRDLVIMRLVEPVSKLQSLELLSAYFGIHHPKNAMYQTLLRLKTVQTDMESAAITFAKIHLNFDFTFVFYDVTTLYFESFSSDEDETKENHIVSQGIRKCGFSKDNKFNQPQIVIGLLVNNDGFPLSVQIFPGNTFEGHTFLPSILKLKNKYHIADVTVVADAAMISQANVDQLSENNLTYIVGARLGNLSPSTIKTIQVGLVDTMGVGVNEKTTRLHTDKGDLICQFSRKRYAKDKNDMMKQLDHAKQVISRPGDSLKRLKFIKQTTKNIPTLNNELIAKTTALLGIKGYYTNLGTTSDREIVDNYRDLWHIRPVAN